MESGEAATDNPQTSTANSPASAVSADESAKPATLTKANLSVAERKALRAKRFGSSDGSTTSSSSGKNLATGKSKPDDEVLKKRAERFGMTSETAAENKSKTSSRPDLDVLKKRAQRFGVISDKVKKLDYQEKLRKRQEKFAK